MFGSVILTYHFVQLYFLCNAFKFVHCTGNNAYLAIRSVSHDPYTVIQEQEGPVGLRNDMCDDKGVLILHHRYEGVDEPLPKNRPSQNEQDPYSVRIMKAIDL